MTRKPRHRIANRRRDIPTPMPRPLPRQPWLGTGPGRQDDDFSPGSATFTYRKALAALALAFLILAIGRAPHITSAAYSLPIMPGTDAVIAAAEGWEAATGWMRF